MSRAAVALIHGLGSSAAAWTPVLPLLEARGFDATPIELPGYGATIFGTRDQRIAPAAIAAVREQRPESVVELATSGHTPMWETPELAADAIAAAAEKVRA